MTLLNIFVSLLVHMHVRVRVAACVSTFLLQLEGKLTLHQHLSDLVDLALTMMKVMDEINSDSFQSFKLRIGEECVHTLRVMASTRTLQLDPQWKLVRIYV